MHLWYWIKNILPQELEQKELELQTYVPIFTKGQKVKSIYGDQEMVVEWDAITDLGPRVKCCWFNNIGNLNALRFKHDELITLK